MLGEIVMQLLNNEYNLGNNELLIEKTIGWSSACLDSTIDYYIDCNSTDEKIDNHEENPQEKANV
uniref:Uncharacterized protein n=1 Tax=Sporolithon durum TaxID=48970 RepID=A0A141SCV9_9FLOR|nr:hypothetical protein Sdur_072 [Sporolithon durum]AMK96127.1 hypothetical protein Sdur_072 [Sporolithon durum]